MIIYIITKTKTGGKYMYHNMNRCEYKSLIQYIIHHRLFINKDTFMESFHCKKNNISYTFQILFKQKDVLLTLYEYDSQKKISNIFNYVFATHQSMNKNGISKNKIGIDNSKYYPCNNAWKWILPFTQQIQYVLFGI